LVSARWRGWAGRLGRARWRGWAGRLGWAAGVAVAGAGLFWCYLLVSRTAGVTSDASSNALQAWDMLHGNVLLHGWWLSDVSFYTTELPEYALVEWVHGLRPDDVHICAAITYTLLVLLTALVARGTARGREGTIRALLGGGLLLAPTLGFTSNAVLASPDHTGTGVPIMAALLLLDRVKPRWYVPVAILLILGWVEVADPLALVAGAAPVGAVCLFRAAKWLVPRWRSSEGGPGWYDPALAVAAGGSVLAARFAVEAIRAHGGFYVNPVPGTLFATTSALPHQLRTTGLSVLILFGADPVAQPDGLPLTFALIHLAGIAVAAVGLLIGLWRFLGRLDRVSQILLCGTLAVLAAGWLGTHMSSGFSAHEIAPVLPFGAALAGRMVGERLAGLPRRWAEPALAIGLAGYLAALGFLAAQPSVPAADRDPDLAALLVSHGLRDGLAGYWQASSTTLETGGQVTLAPIYGGSAYLWEVKAAWYDPATRYANFLVTVSEPPAEAVFTKPSVMRRLFGRPIAEYLLGRYSVLVYDKNLLLTLIPFPAPP